MGSDSYTFTFICYFIWTCKSHLRLLVSQATARGGSDFDLNVALAMIPESAWARRSPRYDERIIAIETIHHVDSIMLSYHTCQEGYYIALRSYTHPIRQLTFLITMMQFIWKFIVGFFREKFFLIFPKNKRNAKYFFAY